MVLINQTLFLFKNASLGVVTYLGGGIRQNRPLFCVNKGFGRKKDFVSRENVSIGTFSRETDGIRLTRSSIEDKINYPHIVICLCVKKRNYVESKLCNRLY